MNTPGSYKYNDYIYINSRFESSPNEEEEERKKRYEEGEIFLFEKCIKWFFFVDFLSMIIPKPYVYCLYFKASWTTTGTS